MRERELEREKNFGGNANSHREFEGGWTFVSYRRTGRREASGRKQTFNVHNSYRSWREMSRRWSERGVSIFIDNLPTFYDNLLLRKLFSNIGKICNCYTPAKRRVKTQTRYGFVSFIREEDAMAAIKSLDGIVIFKHKLKVMKSRVVGTEKVKVGKEKTVGSKPVGYRTKSYAEAVAWKEKVFSGNGEVKEPEQGMLGVTGKEPLLAELVSQLKEMRDLQIEQEKRFEDLTLMCLALKNEIHQRLGLGGFRREEAYDDDGVDAGVSKEEEEDNVSKVAGSVIGEEELLGRDDIGCEMEGEKFQKGEGFIDDVFIEEVEEDVLVDDGSVREEGEMEGENIQNEEDGGEQGEMEAVKGRNKSNGHISLITKPTSLRFNHIGANSGIIFLSKKKKRQACGKGADIRVEQTSSSRTDSIEPEIGKEFTSKQSREYDIWVREEAEVTMEVGRLVGVTFDPNNSSAIDKLMAMGV